MSSGHIYVAEQDGVHVIKLVGDVRLTLCVSFDRFIESLFVTKKLRAVIFDLRETEGIDSTTLGLMAKISIGAREKRLEPPVAVVNDPSIMRLLVSMGLEDILRLVKEQDIPDGDKAQPLPEVTEDQGEVRSRVLEAHEILIRMNRSNEVKFKELVETLQSEE